MKHCQWTSSRGVVIISIRVRGEKFQPAPTIQSRNLKFNEWHSIGGNLTSSLCAYRFLCIEIYFATHLQSSVMGPIGSGKTTVSIQRKRRFSNYDFTLYSS